MCSELHFAPCRHRRKPALSVSISYKYAFPAHWFAGCILFLACVLGQRPGCFVTTLFGNAIESSDIQIQAIPAAAPKKSHGWLPLLTVLFMISYGLMTMLIVEQGQTIESQRALIRELFRDSAELSATKLRAQRAARAAAAQNPSAQNPSTQAPSTQAPSVQAPSTQVQNRPAPFSQGGPQQHVQIQTRPKSQFQMPSRPASDLQDSRRALITI
jgi:hypothetical protein